MLSGSPPDERRKCRVEAISKGIYFLEENRMILRWNFARFSLLFWFVWFFFKLFVYRKMVKYKMLFAVAVSLRESLFFLCRWLPLVFPFFFYDVVVVLIFDGILVLCFFFFLYSCRCYFLCGISRNGILFSMIIRFVFWWRKANTLPNLGKENGMTKWDEIVLRVFDLHCGTPLSHG